MEKAPFPYYTAVLLLFAFLAACSPSDDGAVETPDPSSDPEPVPDMNEPLGYTPCQGGMAGEYPCSGFDLVARLGLDALNAASGNDIWGWTDPQDGTEYALVGLDNGTAFVSLADPENPVYLGKLPTRTTASAWRDIKVYRDHAYIVSEASGHGMQVFDLTGLRDVTSPPVTFSATTEYSAFGNAHNIAINEESGFAYVVGTGPELPYQGGPHFIDLNDPANPADAGGYALSGYTHDAQAVTYEGPDADYANREILVGANEDQVLILDVTDKSLPVVIASTGYANLGYPHQGWFTEDQRYFILGDEADELNSGINSRTLVFDFADLDNPVLAFSHTGATPAIDHNGYIVGDRFYLSNYTAGLRVLDLSGLTGGQLAEAGYFDTHPESDNPSFEGAWSVYPYFASGLIAIGDINRGLFVIRPGNASP